MAILIGMDWLLIGIKRAAEIRRWTGIDVLSSGNYVQIRRNKGIASR
jgi:hypothetical protein